MSHILFDSGPYSQYISSARTMASTNRPRSSQQQLLLGPLLLDHISRPHKKPSRTSYSELSIAPIPGLSPSPTKQPIFSSAWVPTTGTSQWPVPGPSSSLPPTSGPFGIVHNVSNKHFDLGIYCRTIPNTRDKAISIVHSAANILFDIGPLLPLHL